MADQEHLDVLTVTATSLQTLLNAGTFTTSSIIPYYLEQIDKHNHQGVHLNAIISVAPAAKLKKRAAQLDEERKNGHIRSPLHGLPILVKDNILTSESLGMDTTCGSYALKGVKAKSNAPVVQTLIDAGVIILGKANLTVGVLCRRHDSSSSLLI